MKLYTEEQVKLMIEKSRETGLTAEYLTLTTPAIELPSDEEMEKELLEHTKVSTIDPYKSFYFNAAMYGAKWVIEQIKQQKDGTDTK